MLIMNNKYVYYVFFFKQKTAYEIKECDWSSDVCSSDLFKDHEYVDAILILERLKMLTPENRLVLARLGMSYANTNNYAQAVTELTKALSIKQYVRVHSNHPIEFKIGRASCRERV